MDQIYNTVFSPVPMQYVMIGIEKVSHYVAASLIGKAWNSEAVLRGQASADDYSRFFSVTLMCCHSITFWLVCAYFGISFKVLPTDVVAKWRFHGLKHEPWSQIYWGIAYVASFHAAISYFTYHYMGPWLLERKFLGPITTNLLDTAPSLPMVYCLLLACLVCTDFAFYWAHKLLHDIDFLYQYVHKMHHAWKMTECFAAEYAHPVELILGNIFPVILGPALLVKFLGANPMIWFVWMIMAIRGTCLGHSGTQYKRPLAPPDESDHHSFHHSVNIGNYGTLNQTWDPWMGTDKKYQEHLAKRRADATKNKTEQQRDPSVELNRALARVSTRGSTRTSSAAAKKKSASRSVSRTRKSKK